MNPKSTVYRADGPHDICNLGALFLFPYLCVLLTHSFLYPSCPTRYPFLSLHYLYWKFDTSRNLSAFGISLLKKTRTPLQTPQKLRQRSHSKRDSYNPLSPSLNFGLTYQIAHSSSSYKRLFDRYVCPHNLQGYIPDIYNITTKFVSSKVL